MRLTAAGNRLLCAVLTMGLCTTMALPARAEADLAAQAVQSYNKAVKAYRQGDFERAVNYLKRTLVTDPQNTNARYYLAVCLDRLDLDGEAVPEYRFVVSHSRDQRLVSYAENRLSLLQPSSPSIEPAPAMVAAASGSALPTASRLSSRIVVPLKNNRNALMVDGWVVNDRAGQRSHGTFIIDTGATYTSISRDMAEKLGLDLQNCEHVRITTANGRIDVPKVVIDRLSVNGLEARNVEATVIDVRKGSTFHGLLGLSFIRQFVLTIDPGANQLIFQKN